MVEGGVPLTSRYDGAFRLFCTVGSLLPLCEFQGLKDKHPLPAPLSSSLSFLNVWRTELNVLVQMQTDVDFPGRPESWQAVVVLDPQAPHPQAPICSVSLFPSPGKGNGELQECHSHACPTFQVRFCNSFLVETAGKREYCTGVKNFGDPLWKTKHHLILEHQFKGACAFQVLITNIFT